MNVLAVYAATAEPQPGEVLYLCTWDGFVINGQYRLKEGENGAFLLPCGKALMLRGHILSSSRDSQGEYVDHAEVLKRFRAGERCSEKTCSECGHDPDLPDLPTLAGLRIAILALAANIDALVRVEGPLPEKLKTHAALAAKDARELLGDTP